MTFTTHPADGQTFARPSPGKDTDEEKHDRNYPQQLGEKIDDETPKHRVDITEGVYTAEHKECHHRHGENDVGKINGKKPFGILTHWLMLRSSF